MYFRPCFLLLLLVFSCKTDEGADNRPPGIPVAQSELVGLNPFTFRFKATATDQDLDPLTYTWNFGDGQSGTGEVVTHSYAAEGKEYPVTVTVSDGRQTSVATLAVSTVTQTLRIDPAQRFQTIEGFGGFGGQDVYYRPGPHTSAQFVNDVVVDLGLTIHREEIPLSFEAVNDNDDPNVTDLSRFNLSQPTPEDGTVTVAQHFAVMKSLKDAGVSKFIASVWSPPRWMKYNNKTGNGTTDQTSAPPYTTNPTAQTNQLRPELYPEFAETLVAYVRLLKRETGIDLYAVSLQNEPRFSQFYQSCVYSGEALRDLVKVVGARFRREGLTTKLFLPEDLEYQDAVRGLLMPTLNDPEARQYVGIVAVHGYARDGVLPGSADARTWQEIYGWGQPFNLPVWMTETSGFKNTHAGAMELAVAMYTALRHGNVSAWVFWTLAEQTLSEYSLMSSTGEKSKRFFVSKQFYRYVRPGAVRVGVSGETDQLLALPFRNGAQTAVVLINRGSGAAVVKLEGLSGKATQWTTSGTQNAALVQEGTADNSFMLPGNSVSTVVAE